MPASDGSGTRFCGRSESRCFFILILICFKNIAISDTKDRKPISGTCCRQAPFTVSYGYFLQSMRSESKMSRGVIPIPKTHRPLSDNPSGLPVPHGTQAGSKPKSYAVCWKNWATRSMTLSPWTTLVFIVPVPRVLWTYRMPNIFFKSPNE